MNKMQIGAAIAVSLFGCAGVAQAEPGEPLSECVDLSAGHQATRFGTQYLMVKDGDEHYRLGFGGSCDTLSTSSTVRISTDSAANRLCPEGTQVSTKRDTCKVRRVEEIRPDEFERYAKRARR